MKILVAEDEIYSRKSMVKQIVDSQIFPQLDILEAENGQEAWEIFLSEKPDIVISDIRMPLMDGIRLLKLILEEKSDTKILMVSGYADFDYAYNALNFGAEGYILKPVSGKELRKYLNKFLDQNEEQTVKNLLSGQDSVTKSISKHINEASYEPDFLSDKIIDKIFPEYRILAISFSNTGKPESSDFLKSIKDMNGNNIWTEFRIVQISHRLWAMIIRDEHRDALIDSMGKYFTENSYNHHIGISDLSSGAQDIKRAYNQALTALKSKVFYKSRVIYHKDAAKRRGTAAVNSDNNEMLGFYLQKSDAPNCWAIVESSVNKIFGIQDASVLYLENYLSGVIISLQKAMFKNGMQAKDKIEFDLLEYDSKEEILYSLRKWIEFICAQVKQSDAYGEDDIVPLIVEYINKNYNNDISLKDIAEKIFFLNYSYISHKFKTQMGVSYSEYLKKIRIEKAKKYLESRNMSITDAAMLTGYNDVSRFIQIFKKTVGMTPKSYRDSKLNNIGE